MQIVALTLKRLGLFQVEHTLLHRIEVLALSSHRLDARADARLELIHEPVVFGEAILRVAVAQICGQQVARLNRCCCGRRREHRRADGRVSAGSAARVGRENAAGALRRGHLADGRICRREADRCAPQFEKSARAPRAALALLVRCLLFAQLFQSLAPELAFLLGVREMLQSACIRKKLV